MDLQDTAILVSQTFLNEEGANEVYENTAKSVLGKLGVEEPSNQDINGMSHFLAKVTGGTDPNTPHYIGSNQVKAQLDKVGIESDNIIQAGIMSAVNESIHANVSPENTPTLIREEFNNAAPIEGGFEPSHTPELGMPGLG